MSPQTEMFLKNQKWVAEKKAIDPLYFEKLSKGQSPDYLYIGCSDSRVNVEEIIGLEPGEIFVHRNLANLVVSTDNNLNAVVQYATEHLHVKHVIVCGHTGCGGIQAALNPTDMGQLNSWLQTLRDVRRLHHQELSKISDEKKRFDRLVELNVLEQCINIVKIDHVQRSWYKTGFPKVHGWVFDMRTGKLKDLELNVESVLGNLREIYDLKPET